MNKLTLIFTTLRVYRQARGQEGSTIRGIITGVLAAGAVVGLWYMGADMDAQQIGLVLSAIAGIDSVFKIVMPDKIGDRKQDGHTNEVPVLPPIDLVARKSSTVYHDGAIDDRGGVAADGMCQSVPSNRDPDADTQPNRWDSSDFGDK